MSAFKFGCMVAVLAVTYTALKSSFQQRLPVVVGGYHHPAFKRLADAFREQVESGKEKGGAFSVYHHGDLVFDMWGGYADEQARRPWQRDTMAQVFSTSKGVVAIVMAFLEEKGLVDYKRPVADYWPEFGQNDKGNITVEMLLSHQAGLVVLDESINLRDILENPKKVEGILARQKTIWPAGTNLGYHMVTYGLYVDTLIQKLDPKGRTSTQVFLEDIAKPFEIDAFLNCPKELFYRASRIHSGSEMEMFANSVFSKKYFPIFAYFVLYPDSLVKRASNTIKDMSTDSSNLNNPDLREVTMSSASTHATARGLAKLYGILGNGGKLGDKLLLKKNTIDKLSEPLVSGLDETTRLPGTTYGRGTWLVKNPQGQFVFGHPGHGGNVACADPANNLGYAYITNFLSIYGAGDDPRFTSLHDVMYECIKALDKSK